MTGMIRSAFVRCLSTWLPFPWDDMTFAGVINPALILCCFAVNDQNLHQAHKVLSKPLCEFNSSYLTQNTIYALSIVVDNLNR